MPEAGTHRSELKNTGYEIFIGILSVLSIFNLVLLYAIEDASLNTVLRFINAILSGVFLDRLQLPAVHRRVEVPLLLPHVRLGRPSRQPALPTGEGAARLPPPARVPSASRVRHQQRRSQPAPRPRRKRIADPAADGHLGAGVRQSRDPPRRAGRPRGQHHHSLRRPLVQHRHHLDRGLRRPLPRDQRRTDRRLVHHRHRRRHLRHLHRLPGQPLPLTVKEAGCRATTGCRPRPTARRRTAAEHSWPSNRLRSTKSTCSF